VGKSGQIHLRSARRTNESRLGMCFCGEQVPYPLISLVTRLPQTFTGKSPLTIRTRTFENLLLSFERDTEASDVFESVKELTVASKSLPPPHPNVRSEGKLINSTLPDSVTQLYAFAYIPSPPLPTRNGWSIYSPREEFGRMGIGSRTKAWRFTDINKDYSVGALLLWRNMLVRR
jgi:myotubularin-related protein 6/7/8